MQADARQRGRDSLEGMKLADARPLELRTVALSTETVATFSPVELTADIAASYDNPFDPDQIAVDAEVIAPDGKAVTVPGFFDVPMRLETTRGSERLVPGGAPGFRVRYAPAVAGKHRLVLKVTDRSGTVRSAPRELTATASPSSGFVRVSRQSPRYFAHDDGRPFFAIGENVCWSGNRTPVADDAAWLKKLGAAGGNWARLWLAYNEKGLEWMPAPTPKPRTGTFLGLGRYSPGNAWRLDEVVRLARENDVCLMFCLGTYGEFTEGGYFNEGCWVSNPYNAKNGGPCARPAGRLLDQSRSQEAVPEATPPGSAPTSISLRLTCTAKPGTPPTSPARSSSRPARPCPTTTPTCWPSSASTGRPATSAGIASGAA